jgi:hypothetical protein
MVVWLKQIAVRAAFVFTFLAAFAWALGRLAEQVVVRAAGTGEVTLNRAGGTEWAGLVRYGLFGVAMLIAFDLAGRALERSKARANAATTPAPTNAAS